MKIAFGLFLGAMIGFVIACGGAKAGKAPTTAPLGVGGSGDVLPPTKRSEIERLAAEINQGIEKLSVGVPTRRIDDPIPTASNIVPPSADATCKPAQTDSCKDTCTLSESICNNAKLICEIAAEMNNDAWADEKCANGKLSCDAARTKCCGCTL